MFSFLQLYAGTSKTNSKTGNNCKARIIFNLHKIYMVFSKYTKLWLQLFRKRYSGPFYFPSGSPFPALQIGDPEGLNNRRGPRRKPISVRNLRNCQQPASPAIAIAPHPLHRLRWRGCGALITFTRVITCFEQQRRKPARDRIKKVCIFVVAVQGTQRRERLPTTDIYNSQRNL